VHFGEVANMSSKLQQVGLVVLGAALGIAASLHFSAIADRQATVQLPVDDLRLFSEVFGRIKNDYVEPVEDKKLLRKRSTGCSRPRPALRLPRPGRYRTPGRHPGEFGGLGIEVGSEDGFVKVVAPIEDTPAHRAGIQGGDLIIKLDGAS